MYCTYCGCFTSRAPLGQPLCEPCHRLEDEEIEHAERAEAKRLGVRYGWSDDQPAPAAPAQR
jgi:hypothetical protein